LGSISKTVMGQASDHSLSLSAWIWRFSFMSLPPPSTFDFRGTGLLKLLDMLPIIELNFLDS